MIVCMCTGASPCAKVFRPFRASAFRRMECLPFSFREKPSFVSGIFCNFATSNVMMTCL